MEADEAVYTEQNDITLFWSKINQGERIHLLLPREEDKL